MRPERSREIPSQRSTPIGRVSRPFRSHILFYFRFTGLKPCALFSWAFSPQGMTRRFERWSTLLSQFGTDANPGPTTLDRKIYPLCQTSVITTQLPHHEAPWRVRAVRRALLGGSGGIVLVGKLKRESDVDRIDRIDTIGTTGRFGKIRTTERASLVWRQRRHSLTGGSLERNRFGQRPSPCIGSDR